LLDLSKANPLLGINRSRVTKLRVRAPGSEELFRRFVVDEEKLCLPLPRKARARRERDLFSDTPEVALTTDETPEQWTMTSGDIEFEGSAEELSRKIRRIHDNAHTTVEERGVTTLFLTFGILEWDDPLLGPSRTPIWMVPAQLERSGQLAPLRISLADEEMQLNPALELYVRERHKITLPPLPEEPSTESLGQYLGQTSPLVQDLGWKICDETWLSTYSFESLVLYQDLSAMAETALRTPLIAALARAGAEPEGSEALGEDLDSLPVARMPIPVLPSDSSQLEALAIAASGRHVVIHGPPGTGKSQTIASLIADALGRGQKVLFVSAKMAALEVVYRRLRERGLADFCLEAHSTKAGKAKVIEELRRTLELEVTGGDGDPRQDEEDLIRIRESLNAYVRALHRPVELLGLTVYQGIGKVARLRSARSIRFQLPWEHVLDVTRAQLSGVREIVDNLAGQAAVFDRRSTHPLRGLNTTSTSVAYQEMVEDRLKELGRAGLTALEALGAVGWPGAEKLSLTELDADARGFEIFASCTVLPAEWRTRPRETMEEAAKMLEEAAGIATDARERLQAQRATLLIDPELAAELLAPLRDRFKSLWASLTPSYWRWHGRARKIFRPGAPTKRLHLLRALRAAESYLELKQSLSSRAPNLAREVDAARVEDPEALAAGAHALRSALLIRGSRLALARLPDPTAESQKAIRELLRVFPSRNENVSRALKEIDQLWPAGFAETVPARDAAIAALLKRIGEVLPALPRMGEWLQLHRALELARAHGLGPFVDALEGISAWDAPAAFEKRFYTLWTSAGVERSPELESFLGSKREELISRFRELDEKIRVSVARRIRAVAGEPAGRIRHADPSVGTASEVGILRRELQKRKRIKPLRRLFDEIPQVLQALKPCMLMSPISVSTYLKPGSLQFDVVVFDEASQLPTQEAIPAILRARQVVVAGDTKQLPPTTFFMSSLLGADDENEDEELESLEPLESLLDDCIAIVPHFSEAYLRWHYRSRDERLIAFSNYLFYEGRLHTFPSASTAVDGRGVEFIFVQDGVYGRGKDRRNPREARVVAQTVVRQLERYPERSIGVVSMGLSQKDAIEDALEEEFAERPDLQALWERGGTEPCFVKALENVQGDERDTMIISVGYGKDRDGAFTYNFGPLNAAGGERRLNVLVTRAKWHTILVSSLRSADLAGVNPNNKGANALRSFVAYAETGELPRPAARDTDAETNDFEDAVREALIERGLIVDAQVGVSRYRIDLGIRDPRDPSRYLIGVECDGATYHASRTARDRDLIRQQVLREMGWRIHRLWSTNWFRDPDGAIAQVLLSAEQAEREPVERSVEAPHSAFVDRVRNLPEPDGSTNTPAPVHATKYTKGVPYQRYPGPRRDRQNMLLPSRCRELEAVLVDVVRVEAPIFDEFLLERLREVHAIERAGTNIRKNFENALASAHMTRRVAIARERSDASVITLFGRPAPEGFRVPGHGVRREIEMIPRWEIAFAVLYLVEDQFGMQRERIPTGVVNLFSFERARAQSADRIRDVVDQLIEVRRLRVQGPNVYVT
jgi:very-short-patch-repair endonuclease